MATLDVHLTGLDLAGNEVGKLFAFWWDGYALKTMLKGKLEPTDPWPAWHGVIHVEEIKSFALEHPNVWQTKREALNMEMTYLLEKSTLVRVLIQEA